MSEDPNFSIEWHKGFQIGLYSGISKEQERIIKLLEDNFKTDGAYLVTVEDNKPAKLSELIALIKGENK